MFDGREYNPEITRRAVRRLATLRNRPQRSGVRGAKSSLRIDDFEIMNKLRNARRRTVCRLPPRSVRADLGRQLPATFSTQIVSVAIGWQIYDLTRDPFDLGLVGIIQFLPSLLLVLVTGAIADRFGRRLIMGIAALVEAACAAAILFFTWRNRPVRCRSRGAVACSEIARAFFGRPRPPGRESGAAGSVRQRHSLDLVGLASD